MCRCSSKNCVLKFHIIHVSFFSFRNTLGCQKDLFLQHTDGTAGTIFNVLDCESRHPVLVEKCFKNSFYGHAFPFAASIRAALCLLRKSWNSIMLNYLGGYLEQ